MASSSSSSTIMDEHHSGEVEELSSQAERMSISPEKNVNKDGQNAAATSLSGGSPGGSSGYDLLFLPEKFLADLTTKGETGNLQYIAGKMSGGAYFPILEHLLTTSHPTKAIRLADVNDWKGAEEMVAMQAQLSGNKYKRKHNEKLCKQGDVQIYRYIRYVCSRNGAPPPLKEGSQRNSNSEKCKCQSSIILYNILPSDINNQKFPHLLPGIYLQKAPTVEHSHAAKITTFASFDHMRVNEAGQHIGELLYKTPQSVPKEIEDMLWERAAFYQSVGHDAVKVKNMLQVEEGKPEFKHIIHIKRLTPKIIYNRARIINRAKMTEKQEQDAWQLVIAGTTMASGSCFFWYRNPTTRALERVFWATPVMRQWCDEENKVFVLDTSHKLNKYDMYTCIIACESRYKRSLPVAFSLISFQDQESFEWILDCFMKYRNNREFDTLFSDQDPAIAAAVLRKLPFVTHLLCIWHICSQNLPRNLKKFSIDSSFNEVLNRVWAFAMSNKNYDENAIALEWADIVAFCNAFLADPQPRDREPFLNYRDAHEDDPRIPRSTHLYLNKLWFIRRRWVRRYINNTVFTGHIKSTQRSESLNRVASEKCGIKTRLMEAFKEFNKWCDDIFVAEVTQRSQEDHASYKEVLANQRPIVKSLLSHKLTKYANDKIVTEIFQSDSYNVVVLEELREYEQTYRIKFKVHRFDQASSAHLPVTSIEGELPPTAVEDSQFSSQTDEDESPPEEQQQHHHHHHQYHHHQRPSVEEIEESISSLEQRVEAATSTSDWRKFVFLRHSCNERIVSLTYVARDGKKIVEGGHCTCGSLVHKGYPCRHIFRCLYHLMIHEIADCFLDEKWSRLDPGQLMSVSPNGSNTRGDATSTDLDDGVGSQVAPTLPFDIASLDGVQVMDMREAFLLSVRDLAFQLGKMVLDQQQDGSTSAQEAQKRMTDLKSILEKLLNTNGEHISYVKDLLQAKENLVSMERGGVASRSDGDGDLNSTSGGLESLSSSIPIVLNPVRRGNGEGGGRSGKKHTNVGGARKAKQPRITTGPLKRKNSTVEGGAGRANTGRVDIRGRGGGGGGGGVERGGQSTGSLLGGSQHAQPPLGYYIYSSQPSQDALPGFMHPLPTNTAPPAWMTSSQHPYHNPQHPYHRVPTSQTPFPGFQAAAWSVSDRPPHPPPLAPPLPPPSQRKQTSKNGDLVVKLRLRQEEREVDILM